MQKLMHQVTGGVILRALPQFTEDIAVRKALRSGLGEIADDRSSIRKARCAVAATARRQLAREKLERQVAGPSRHRIVAEINQPASFQMPLDKLAQRGARRR